MNRESTTASKINQKHTQLTLKKRAAQHRRPASAAVTVTPRYVPLSVLIITHKMVICNISFDQREK